MTPEIAAQAQSLAPGTIIELFVLDLEPIGVATTYYFTPTNMPGYTVIFDGNRYAYAPVSISGIERSVSGDPPNPKVLLPNVTKFTSALVTQHQDLVGAQVTRMRTFQDFLDGEPLADPSAVLSRDIYTVEQKLNLTNVMGEFSLRPLYALDGKYLPGRTCLKEVCTHRYRIANADGTFDYSKATCPFTGTNYFLRDGTPTTDARLDACGKALNNCSDRFGEHAELPFRGFPGMSRLRLT